MFELMFDVIKKEKQGFKGLLLVSFLLLCMVLLYVFYFIWFVLFMVCVFSYIVDI